MSARDGIGASRHASVRSTTVPTLIRIALYAMGSSLLVPNFNTAKLRPQMTAIATRPTSVAIIARRASGSAVGVVILAGAEALAGTDRNPVVDTHENYPDGSRPPTTGRLQAAQALVWPDARIVRAFRRRGQPVAGGQAQRPRRVRRPPDRSTACGPSPRDPRGASQGQPRGRWRPFDRLRLDRPARRRDLVVVGRGGSRRPAAGGHRGGHPGYRGN